MKGNRKVCSTPKQKYRNAINIKIIFELQEQNIVGPISSVKSTQISSK